MMIETMFHQVMLINIAIKKADLSIIVGNSLLWKVNIEMSPTSSLAMTQQLKDKQEWRLCISLWPTIFLGKVVWFTTTTGMHTICDFRHRFCKTINKKPISCTFKTSKKVRRSN